MRCIKSPTLYDTPLCLASGIKWRSFVATFPVVMLNGPSDSNTGRARPGPAMIEAKFILDGGGVGWEGIGETDVKAL